MMMMVCVCERDRRGWLVGVQGKSLWWDGRRPRAPCLWLDSNAFTTMPTHIYICYNQRKPHTQGHLREGRGAESAGSPRLLHLARLGHARCVLFCVFRLVIVGFPIACAILIEVWLTIISGRS
jgi:hypothetical protein